MSKTTTKPENTNTKKETNMKKVIVSTVAITLTVILAFAATFYAGVSYERGINNHVKAEAKALSSSVAKQPQSKK